MRNPNKFWIVWSPQGYSPPKVMHKGYSEAFDEANRLAKKNPEEDFYVMGAESWIRSIPYMSVHTYDDIPF